MKKFLSFKLQVLWVVNLNKCCQMFMIQNLKLIQHYVNIIKMHIFNPISTTQSIGNVLLEYNRQTHESLSSYCVTFLILNFQDFQLFHETTCLLHNTYFPTSFILCSRLLGTVYLGNKHIFERVIAKVLFCRSIEYFAKVCGFTTYFHDFTTPYEDKTEFMEPFLV